MIKHIHRTKLYVLKSFKLNVLKHEGWQATKKKIYIKELIP